MLKLLGENITSKYFGYYLWILYLLKCSTNNVLYHCEASDIDQHLQPVSILLSINPLYLKDLGHAATNSVTMLIPIHDLQPLTYG